MAVISLPQQRGQGEMPHTAKRGSNSPSIIRLVGLKATKALQQIEGRTIDFHRINRRPAMEPLAPPSGVSSAALPPSGGSLDHAWLRREQMFGAE
jgi:hypothetical protein